ncbi:MAG: hypothetical protein CMF48_07175 [Legionellales bacterium]|nr:hypothetical protein [Legionellales bacterium]|tara:strand:- start:615 stop:1190 length:576 start_codon:yes stop_codon:yes gene_type:complete
MKKKLYSILFSFPLLLLLPTVAVAEAPYNFYAPAPVKLIENVENNHLPQAERELAKGNLDFAWGELAFVLHYFPNHPKALRQAGELSITMGAPAKAVTLFERALNLYPSVSETAGIYGEFLVEAHLNDAAITRLLPLVEEEKVHLTLRYPLGLAYFAQGNIAKAKEQADILREHGYPFPTLKDKLAAVGAW